MSSIINVQYQGPILEGPNAYEWEKQARRFLKAQLVWRTYTTAPEEGWEKDPSKYDAQDAAIARLSSMVSPSIADRLLAKCKTAKAAWESLQVAFCQKDKVRASRIASTLGSLKFLETDNPTAFVNQIEDLSGQLKFYSGEDVSDIELSRWLLGAVMDVASIRSWAWERLRDDSPKWDKLKFEFTNLLTEFVVPVHTAMAATSNNLQFNFAAPNEIKEDELLEALDKAGVKVCFKHKRVGNHRTKDCTVSERGRYTSSSSKAPAPSTSNRKDTNAKGTASVATQEQALAPSLNAEVDAHLNLAELLRFN